MRLIALALLVLGGASLSGCGGLVLVARGSGAFTVEDPYLQILAPPRPAAVHEGVRRRAATLRGFWGEPERVTPLGPGRERWRYATGLRWHGVALLVVVLPVPLLVPTGRHHVEVLVEDGRLVGARGTAGATLARAGCAVGLPFPIGRVAGCGWEGCQPPPALVERGGLRLGEPPPRPTPGPAPSSQPLRREPPGR